MWITGIHGKMQIDVDLSLRIHRMLDSVKPYFLQEFEICQQLSIFVGNIRKILLLMENSSLL